MMTPVPFGWWLAAACRSSPPITDLFFPVREQESSDAVCQVYCSSCVVRLACLEQALDAGRECHGIWGGLGSAKRRNLREARSRQVREGFSPHRFTPGCGCSFCALASDYLAGRIVNRNTAGARCGYVATYVKNCRCAACTLAMALDRRRKRTLEAA